MRAKCNQRLFFDAASLFIRVRDYTNYILKGGKEISQEKIDTIYLAYDILEAFLASDEFLVGKTLTIADISNAVTVILLETYAPLKTEKNSKIIDWLKRVRQTIPFFDEINMKPSDDYRQMIVNVLEKNNQQ